MKNQVVTRVEYKAASNAINKLVPALDSLKKIDGQTVDDITLQKIQELCSVLETIHAQHQAVIAKGDQQYQDRPEELINQAANRLHKIPHLIEGEKKSLSGLTESRLHKIEELKAKRFTPDEIAKIVQPVGPEEIDASAARIASMEAESRSIEAFLADAPRFDIEILKGTMLYPFRPGKAA